MFGWYHGATLCIAYLYDTDANMPFQSQLPAPLHQKSEWFTPRWILQELLAPSHMHFYDGNWKFIGEKKVFLVPWNFLLAWMLFILQAKGYYKS